MYWDKSLIKEAGRLTNYQSNLVWMYVNGFFFSNELLFYIQDILHIYLSLKKLMLSYISIQGSPSQEDQYSLQIAMIIQPP